MKVLFLFLRIVTLKRDYDSLIIHKSNYHYLIHSTRSSESDLFNESVEPNRSEWFTGVNRELIEPSYLVLVNLIGVQI